MLREKLNLDQLELQDDKEIIIDIPLYVISFNPSYFIGLSGPSIKKYKTKENFLKKYKFKCDKFILRDIDNNIDYALKIIKNL